VAAGIHRFAPARRASRLNLAPCREGFSADDREAVDPPRGARRREAAASSGDVRVREGTYVQASPPALSEEIIDRHEDVRRRLSKATGAKVSTVKVLRESLV